MMFGKFPPDAPYPRRWLRLNRDDLYGPRLEMVTDLAEDDDPVVKDLGPLEDAEDAIPDDRILQSQYVFLLAEAINEGLDALAVGVQDQREYDATRGTFDR